MEKWVNCLHVSINEKNLQNIGLKGTLIKFNHMKRLFEYYKKSF